MTPASLAWRVEETCLNAWPALRQVLLDGWVLRFSDGLTRRANSANPLRADCKRTDALILACEALYRRQLLPTIFRVPSIIDPDLGERLDALGYGCEGESWILYGDIDAVASARDPEVQLSALPTPEWFRAMGELQNHTIEQSGIHPDRTERDPSPDRWRDRHPRCVRRTRDRRRIRGARLWRAA